MKLTLTDIKKIAKSEIEKDRPLIMIAFYSPATEHSGSEVLTPYHVILKWNQELQDYESNLELN